MPTDHEHAVRQWLVGGIGDDPTDDRSQDGMPRDAAGLLSRMVQAFPGNPVGPGERLDAGAALVALTPPRNALSALISVEATSCRITTDGPPPTAAVGLLLAAGTVIAVTGRPSLLAFQAIGTGAGSILNVLYFD